MKKVPMIQNTRSEELFFEAKRVVALLQEIGKTVATAESCTGGLLGKCLTDVSGSSGVYPGGVISYSCDVKYRILGVDRHLLDTEGAVCPEVAKQMAEGVRRVIGADYGISTTGIAGPNGDGSGKPVGLVYVAIASSMRTQVYTLHLSGSREEIRENTAKAAFSFLENETISDAQSSLK